MAVTTPELSVTVNGEATPVLEAHTSHSVDSPVAQASLTLPLPLAANVKNNAPVVIEMGADGTSERVFQGRIRGPFERGLSESDRTVTVRCDGNLWRAAFPRLTDLSFPGPISVRKVIRSILTFHGVTDIRIEQFVHPVTGKVLKLGGEVQFDAGLVILPAGTSPLAFCERICKLFGYRIFDAPDGSVRVARISGRPHDPDFTLTEGTDLLSASRSHDLHELVTQWTAEGASGTDILGQEVAIVSRPVGGIESEFVPAPPTYVAGTVSDALLVTQNLANAARMAAEYDFGGVAIRVRAEAAGQVRGTPGLAKKWSFKVAAASVGLTDNNTFWLTGVSRDFTESGYWVSYEGWRPGGRPVSTAANPPVPPVLDPDTTVPDVPDYAIGAPDIPAPTYPEDLYPENPWNNIDGDLSPPALEAPEFDPAIDPDGPDAPPDVGDVFPCDPAAAAPPRRCGIAQVLESYDQRAVTAEEPAILPFTPTVAADTVTVRGETDQPGGAVEIWQDALMIGTEPIPDPEPGVWTEFQVSIACALVTAAVAECRIVYVEPA